MNNSTFQYLTEVLGISSFVVPLSPNTTSLNFIRQKKKVLFIGLYQIPSLKSDGPVKDLFTRMVQAMKLSLQEVELIEIHRKTLYNVENRTNESLSTNDSEISSNRATSGSLIPHFSPQASPHPPDHSSLLMSPHSSDQVSALAFPHALSDVFLNSFPFVVLFDSAFLSRSECLHTLQSLGRCLVTESPQILLEQPQRKRKAWEDLKRVMAQLSNFG